MPAPRQRRERCAFHYKVDESLRGEDREAYLALLREPGTTIDAAHRWLTKRGYTMSRSAVARHRRRTLNADVARAEQRELLKALAQMASEPGAPDFAAGAEMQWQCVVFQRLIDAGEFIGHSSDPRADDSPAPPTLAELNALGKLVAQSIELTRRRLETRQNDRVARGRK